jgi:hypothetical protein
MRNEISKLRFWIGDRKSLDAVFEPDEPASEVSQILDCAQENRSVTRRNRKARIRLADNRPLEPWALQEVYRNARDFAPSRRFANPSNLRGRV